MNKIKYILLLVGIAGCFAACKKNDTPEFDHVGQFKIDTVLIRNFVNEKELEDVIKDEEFGIFYQIIAPGAGDVTIANNSTINADYKGRLLNGNVFDSGVSQQFSLSQVIPSWQFVTKIKKGGTIRIIAPSFYGYRNIANDRIPANSVLDFDITVNDIIR
ncbi:MAG TPA: FKBP-type peptidyl-prolyl cis-trans isomerase [Pedobacter sp.]|nr:FKBP-type peptidyl-prolyl cis-trans isomerase [Pedobacter sp.]